MPLPRPTSKSKAYTSHVQCLKERYHSLNKTVQLSEELQVFVVYKLFECFDNTHELAHYLQIFSEQLTWACFD
jgi:hypothetical protein